jgi:AbrB family looped-hinge helix DNA binding protein
MDLMHMPPPTTIMMSSKGQIAIPKEFRLATGLEVGTRIMLLCHDDGSMELRPIKHTPAELFGIAKQFVKSNALQNASARDKKIMQQVLQEDDATKSDSSGKK